MHPSLVEYSYALLHFGNMQICQPLYKVGSKTKKVCPKTASSLINYNPNTACSKSVKEVRFYFAFDVWNQVEQLSLVRDVLVAKLVSYAIGYMGHGWHYKDVWKIGIYYYTCFC